MDHTKPEKHLGKCKDRLMEMKARMMDDAIPEEEPSHCSWRIPSVVPC